MKLIKKIAAIMFAFMMVFSLSTNVKAIEKGSIEINNAIKGQTYKIYKIMELESYNSTEGLYSYKPASPVMKWPLSRQNYTHILKIFSFRLMT